MLEADELQRQNMAALEHGAKDVVELEKRFKQVAEMMYDDALDESDDEDEQREPEPEPEPEPQSAAARVM